MGAKKYIRRAFGDRRVRRIKSIRTLLSARFDIGPWQRPGLHGLDVLLAQAIGNTRGGTFIEIGGNDGLQASNSFVLEQKLSWRGVLIEAIPELAAEAQRNRPLATIVCAAAGSPGARGLMAMDYADLTSSVNLDERGEGAKNTASDNDRSAAPIFVSATTLSDVIDVVAGGKAPDLLSIDVEGFELEVLAGLNLERHRPTWVLVETDKLSSVCAALTGYSRVSQLSYHDHLFKRDDYLA